MTLRLSTLRFCRSDKRSVIRRVLAAFCLSTLQFSAYAAGNVTIYPQNQTIKNVERLADLVTQPSLANAWWPGAVISEKQATAVAEQQHQKLLASLSALAAGEDGDDAAAINGVRQQMQAVHVTGRQFVDLDPDWVRVHPRANVPLQGDYSLWAGVQPATITLVGLVSSPGAKPFVAGRSADEYLDGIDKLSGADRSFAWVIYPDGKTQKAPVAYWNNRHVELTPGSILFVGFKERLLNSDFEQMNQQILHSLTHRRPD
ncbi:MULTISPECIES: capsule biosynthesis GfcC D2 domain-containing protein [Buttiauxella]|uniref:capsule biosynthesis GfcC D2 domain-containing protein n=1 Tax=Buttiauxella TaxID=82976 RepID=UPI000944D42D|nr:MULTISPECIES: capsule biosynthesis GfcC D2 domain-containing protein [Buttiauxella]MCE0827845.1 capsule biosynthesis GfcC family protein [Buttiauxella ferragutiae]